MLKITDIAPTKETKLALDGHVVDVQLTHWENGTNLFCRISHSPRTLAEIWVNEYTCSIVSVTLVVIDTVEIVDQSRPLDESVEIVSGWPCIDTSIWKRDPDRDSYEERFLDVSDTLSAILGSNWLRISFGDTENTSPHRYIQSGQVSFGIDRDDYLISVTLSDLSPDDMQMVRYALIRSESQEAVGCRRILKRLIPFSFLLPVFAFIWRTFLPVILVFRMVLREKSTVFQPIGLFLPVKQANRSSPPTAVFSCSPRFATIPRNNVVSPFGVFPCPIPKFFCSHSRVRWHSARAVTSSLPMA